MAQDLSQFWSRIKELEAKLASNRDSYSFAELSKIYLEVSLVDDALFVAERGVALHPSYIAGQRALGFAAYKKGDISKAVSALKVVAEAIPEDIEALKLFARLSIDSADSVAGENALNTIIDLYPEDYEAKLELDSMRSKPVIEADSEEELIEELDEAEIVELDETDELDEIENDEDGGKMDEPSFAPPVETIQKSYDPLSTATLAELYVKQGFLEKAAEIYKKLLAESPDDPFIAAKLKELEPAPELERESANEPEAATATETETFVTDNYSLPVDAAAVDMLPKEGSADNAVTLLEGWLENIRRIKQCR